MVTGFWGHLSRVGRPMNALRPGGKEASVARRGRTGSTTLEVRSTFEPSWGSPACVAQAYERVVPITRRRAPRAGTPPPAERASQTQQVGRRQHA
jgi:hypothetical protein